VYVDQLTLSAGAVIELNGLNLYYLNGGVPKRLYLGDATLDGSVNYLDLGILATNYGGSGAAWAGGDFTGDEQVNYLDVGILATNYGAGGAGAGGPAGPPHDGAGSTIPEPACMALLAAGCAALLRRRR